MQRVEFEKIFMPFGEREKFLQLHEIFRYIEQNTAQTNKIILAMDLSPSPPRISNGPPLT
jgi:hypothetical protein